ncbi:MAG TPA: penicillin-binding protein activator [Gammaproteobacteria bacterium]|nr:penicillin-binding protein activator [Gammaproteobacteria bacterium]
MKKEILSTSSSPLLWWRGRLTQQHFLIRAAIILIFLNTSSCSSSSSLLSFTPSTTKQTFSSSQAYQTTLWEGNTSTIWEKLQHHSSSKLSAMLNTSHHPNQQAWIELALISKHNSNRTPALAQALLTWRSNNPSHPANQLLPSNEILTQLTTTPVPQQIAILLPLQGDYGSAGQLVREGFLNAYYANLTRIGKQNVSFYDTTQNQQVNALYQQALADGADVIVGPLIKNDVQQLSKFGSFSTPTLALNYTTIYFGSLPRNFYEFGLLPEDEVEQVAERAGEAGLTHAIVIAPENPWGKRLTSTFSARWHTIGGRIQDTLYYSAKSDFNKEIANLLQINVDTDKKLTQEGNNKDILEQQRRHDFDVIFLFAQPKQARIIVPLLRYYYVNKVPIYATSSVYSGAPNPIKDVDLNGVTICDIPWSIQNTRHKTTGPQNDRLYAVGLDAYQLSQSLDRLIQLPHFPIYGTTGALVLAPSHQIHRRLPCHTIRNGTMA